MNQMTTRVKSTQLSQSHLVPALGNFDVVPKYCISFPTLFNCGFCLKVEAHQRGKGYFFYNENGDPSFSSLSLLILYLRSPCAEKHRTFISLDVSLDVRCQEWWRCMFLR